MMRISRPIGVASIVAFCLACDRAQDSPLPEGALEVSGFETPESVLYDDVADVYLVSNINGGGGDREDNGFISRVSPDGTVLDLRWIDGADDGVTLHAPKGSAIIGDSLLVADIDSVRVFDRNTGAPLGAFTVAGATSLNDIAIAHDGAIWISDMGSREPGVAARTGLSRIAPDGTATLVATGDSLEGPNGVVAIGSDVVVAGFRGTSLRRVTPDGVVEIVADLGSSRIDGLVLLADGSLLASTWETSSIVRVAPDGSTSVAFDGLQTPADIGYDTSRDRVLVPSFQGNWLRILPLE